MPYKFFSPLFFLSAALLAASASATCKCHDVCSTYIPGSGCYSVGSSCSVPYCKPLTGIYHRSLLQEKCSAACTSGCVCNFFGCNCEGCGCSGKRELQSVVSNATNNATTTNNATANNCTDYYYYMNLTLSEKIAHFDETNCVSNGLTASAKMVRKLEQLADTNGNGVVSCEEFNGAYFVNTATEESFCTVSTNFTTAPAVAPAGPVSKTSAAVMGPLIQTFLAAAFATGVAFLLA